MINSHVSDIRVAGLADDEQADLAEMLGVWEARRQRNLLRAAYYDGKNFAKHISNEHTPPGMRNLGLVLGWSAKAVDQLSLRCKLERFMPGETGLPVDAVFDDNRLAVEADQAIISALIHGVSFVVTHRGRVADGEPPAIITARDALTSTGLWDARTRRLRAFLSITTFGEDTNPASMILYRRNSIVEMSKSTVGWVITSRRTHPYGLPVEPLVFRARLGRAFGTSRISRPVMSIQNGALRTLLRSEVTSELYQLPQRVLLGADESAFEDGNGNVVPKWQTVLGAVWALGGGDGDVKPDVKQLPGASQTPYLEQLRMQAQLFAGETSIPLASLGFTGDANPTSSESYIAAREDIIAEAENAIAAWRPAWKQSALTGLAMYEGVSEIPDEWRENVSTKWRSPVFTSKQAAADAGLKQLQALPWLAETSVGAELVGLSDEQLTRALAEKRRAEGRIARRQIVAQAQAPSQAPVSGDGESVTEV